MDEFPINLDQGFITMPRGIQETEIFDSSGFFHLFALLVMRARHQPKSYRGILLKIGQCVIGSKELSNKIDQPKSTLWDRLHRLQEMGLIRIKSGRSFTIITIEKYWIYQGKQIEDRTKPAHGSNKEQSRSETKKELKKRKERKYPVE